MQCMSHTPLKLSSQKLQHAFVLLLLAASAVSCSYNNNTTTFYYCITDKQTNAHLGLITQAVSLSWQQHATSMLDYLCFDFTIGWSDHVPFPQFQPSLLQEVFANQAPVHSHINIRCIKLHSSASQTKCCLSMWHSGSRLAEKHMQLDPAIFSSPW